MNRRVNLGLIRGNRNGGVRKGSKHRCIFFSRYLAANDGRESEKIEEAISLHSVGLTDTGGRKSKGGHGGSY